MSVAAMRQQINLYQPIFSEERKLLGGRTVASAFAVLIVALAGFSFYTNVRIGKLGEEVGALRSQQSQQESMLTATGDLQAARAKPVAIEAHIKQLTAAVAERDRALRVLQTGAAGQTAGFAPRLEALARRHVDGLWIDHVTLSGTNGSMSLGGATLNPDIVPVYLDSLSRDSVLTGTRFDEFVIERPAGKADSDASGEKPVPARIGGEIRFRAGSTSLTSLAAEAAT
jgi:hypothetical protein